MKIVIGNDHAGLPLKREVVAYLEGSGIEVVDCGTNKDERTDYPLYAIKVAEKINAGVSDRGILICGTGVGMSITANKVHGIRAVVCSDPYSASLSRMHNNTNVLCMGSRVVGAELAKVIVDQWLSAEYEGGRHQQRLDIIKGLETKK